MVKPVIRSKWAKAKEHLTNSYFLKVGLLSWLIILLTLTEALAFTPLGRRLNNQFKQRLTNWLMAAPAKQLVVEVERFPDSIQPAGYDQQASYLIPQDVAAPISFHDTVSFNTINSDIIPDQDGTYDLGSSTKEWQDLYLDGTAKVDDLTVDNSATIANDLTVEDDLTVKSSLTVAHVSSDLNPDTDDTYDLGSSTKEWQDFYLDGTAYIDTLNIQGALTSSGNILPSSADTYNLGSATAEWNALYLGDDQGLYLGQDQDFHLAYDETTDDQLELSDGTNTFLTVSDQGTSANFVFTGHLLPSANDTYNLGSDSLRWQDVYTGPGTLHIGTSATDEGAISYNTSTDDLEFTTTGGDFYFDIANGNLGIGTTAPSSELHIAGTMPLVTIGDADEEDTAILFDGNAQDFHIGLDDSLDDLVIGTGSTLGSNNVVTIENGGNVGIGTTGPDELLHVDGKLRIEDSTSSGGGVIHHEYGQLNIGADYGSNIHIGPNTADITFGTGVDVIIKNNGNVGIGTTSPNSKLDVNGNITLIDGGTIGTSHENAYFKATQWGVDMFYGNASAVKVDTDETIINSNGYDRDLRVKSQGASGIQAFFLDGASGNVGIGTASPGERLSVDGGALIGSTSWAESSLGTGADLAIEGNVGIGTTGPDRLLHAEVSNASTNVVTPGLRLAHITSGTAAAGLGTSIEFEIEGADGTNNVLAEIEGIQTGAGTGAEEGALTFLTADIGDDSLAERMRIDKDGNLGVGTTAPGGILDVSHDGGTSDDLLVNSSTGVVTMANVYGHDMNGETLRDLQINDSGELGYDSGSRMEWKTNIDYTAPTDWIYNLNIFSFEYKQKDESGNYLEGTATGVKEYSFDAEELDKVLPYNQTAMLYRDSQGRPLGVNFKKLVPVLIKEIQQHQHRLTGLEKSFSLDQQGNLILPCQKEEENGDDQSLTALNSRLTTLEQQFDLFSQEQESTASALLEQVNSLSGRVADLEAQVELLTLEATTSALLTQADSIATDSATLDELNVLGQTIVNDLGITGQITSGLLVIDGLKTDELSDQAYTSISTLSGPLKLQETALGGLEIMAGQVNIDTQGNVSIKGDLAVKGRVKADQFCIDDLCLTKEDLKRIIESTKSAERSLKN